MTSADDIARAINIVLSSIHRTIQDTRDVGFPDDKDEQRIRSLTYMLTGIRERLRFFRMRPSSREMTQGDVDRYKKEVLASLQVLRSNEDFVGYFSRTPFKFSSFSRTEENLRVIENYFGRDMNLSEALDLIEELLAEIDIQPNFLDDSKVNDLEKLRRIVPDQKIAPVQFEFADGRLVISSKNSRIDPADRDSVDSAKASLIAIGEGIIQDLSNSNVDKRLLKNIEELNEQLRGRGNVIQIGLNNIACDMVRSSLKEVLSDTLNATVSAYVMGVDMYVSQFPDWGRFVEQAAAVRIEEDDIAPLKEATDKIIKELEARPDIVSEEVPRAFSKLKELLDDPPKASKRAAFAVLRTIGNLVSKVLSLSFSLLEKTASKTVDGLSTAAAGVIVFGFLTLAVNSAQGISGVASKVNEMSWIRTAIEIVQNQITKLKQ